MKVYVSPTIGRSSDMPEEFRHFFESEECEYRNTIPKRLLVTGDGDVPENIGESLKDGREIVEETVINYKGESEDYISWDYSSVRYYFEVDTIEELDALVLACDKPLTLSRRDPENAFQREFLECIYGLPEIGDCLTAELETERPGDEIDDEELEGEEWKS